MLKYSCEVRVQGDNPYADESAAGILGRITNLVGAQYPFLTILWVEVFHAFGIQLGAVARPEHEDSGWREMEFLREALGAFIRGSRVLSDEDELVIQVPEVGTFTISPVITGGPPNASVMIEIEWREEHSMNVVEILAMFVSIDPAEAIPILHCALGHAAIAARTHGATVVR